MKKLLYVFMVISLLSCGSEKKPSTGASEGLPEKALSSTVFNVLLDSLTTPLKEEHLKTALFGHDQWRDTACGTCGQRCCSPCTAGGNPSQCAETRFKNCSKCGHLSANHYSTPH